MLSPLVSTAVVGLHTGQRLTPGASLGAVVAFLLVVAVVSVVLFRATRLLEPEGPADSEG